MYRGAGKYLIAAAFSALLLFSCQQEEEKIPEGILTPEQIIPVLVDIHLAEAAATFKSGGGVQTNQYAKSHDEYIFKIHHTSRQMFDKSFAYYAKEPKRLSDLYKEVINELSKKQSEVTQVK